MKGLFFYGAAGSQNLPPEFSLAGLQGRGIGFSAPGKVAMDSYASHITLVSLGIPG